MSCSCPNCGSNMVSTRPDYVWNRCNTCGYEFMTTPYDQNRMYLEMRRGRVFWRFVFALAELASFSVSLLFCWLFAQMLDTDVFARHNYLIILVWVYVAYKIYKGMKPKIM